MKRAYTLLELMVVSGLLLFLVGLGTANFTKISRRQAFSQQAKSLLEEMRLVQKKAILGEKPTQCAGKDLEGYYFIFETASAYGVEVLCGGGREGLKTGVSWGGNMTVASPVPPFEIFFEVFGPRVDLPGGVDSLTMRFLNASDSQEAFLNLTSAGLMYL